MTIRYPWPTLKAPLTCAVDDVRVDGAVIMAGRVDDEHLRLRLDGLTWQRLDCRVTVSAEEPIPAEADAVRAYVLLSSAAANTRIPYPLDDTHDGSPSGRLAVPSDAVAGSFALQAHVGATIGGRNRVIGSSEPWTVVLERHEAPVPPGGPPFDIDWVDFTSPDAPLGARENPASHAFMDLAAQPRLLLNQSIEGLQKLLHNNAARLERRRVRDILSASVARHAVASLFRAAMAEIIVYDDGTFEPPTTALYRQVCEAIAAWMSGVGDVDELYERLAGSTDARVSDTDLSARVDVAIDALMGYTDALTTASREVADG
ncbi:hypothetical protein [Actinoplanes auranticolor]|uniref:Uncharacterized protein n=1 Tax=Actinoplanes auranticolor TaxID=47988 RepID=A0A919VT64_9ACTN|nr:hypothetical protein [Actinoplanes auranticolor]GIM74530.1 hypothetical protein Aau02nite_61450 [Actinoplanes auranticolor]